MSMIVGLLNSRGWLEGCHLCNWLSQMLSAILSREQHACPNNKAISAAQVLVQVKGYVCLEGHLSVSLKQICSQNSSQGLQGLQGKAFTFSQEVRLLVCSWNTLILWRKKDAACCSASEMQAHHEILSGETEMQISYGERPPVGVSSGKGHAAHIGHDHPHCTSHRQRKNCDSKLLSHIVGCVHGVWSKPRCAWHHKEGQGSYTCEGCTANAWPEPSL